MSLRQDQLNLLSQTQVYDVLVVGGGINGAVSAASLSSQGAKVALVDQKDFGSGTSQESSNLIWGGIKYLETYEIGLVRELCLSRNFLLKELPEHVHEVRFINPHAKGFRHSIKTLLAGSFLYWFLGQGKTKKPRSYSVKKLLERIPTVKGDLFDGALEYSDATLKEHDSRFVFHFIKQAQKHGAHTLNYVEVKKAVRQNHLWEVELENPQTLETYHLRTKVLLNATGPQVDVFNKSQALETTHQIVLSKGVHLLTRAIGPSEQILAFFASDGRLFFVIPFGGRSLIGTTDTRVTSSDVHVLEEERQFILSNVNERMNLAVPLTLKDIIAERVGVRPLATTKHAYQGQGDWMSLSRRHQLEVQNGEAYLTIFGGKLTDCIPMGIEVSKAIRHLGVFMPRTSAIWWKSQAAQLKDLYLTKLEAFLQKYPNLKTLSEKWWMRHEEMSLDLLVMLEGDVKLSEELFPGAEVVWAEVTLMAANELILHLEDFLRRRTRLALLFSFEDLKAQPALVRVSEILFGHASNEKWNEYFLKS